MTKQTKGQGMTPEQRRRLTAENRDNIETNRQKIKQNNNIIVGLVTFIIIQSSVIGYLFYQQHTIEVCQTKLFTHITGQTGPDREELLKLGDKGLERVKNPQMYKDLFTECE